MDWGKYFAHLTPPLVPAIGICWISGHYLASKHPWHFVLILLFALVICGFLAWAEQRRQVAIRDKERAVKALLAEGQSGGGESRDIWTRPLLQQPLRQTAFEEGAGVLEGVRVEASEALALAAAVSVDTALAKVRANVFLATSDGLRHGDVCNLRIPWDEFNPLGLQVNMEDQAEVRVSFRPNQGATGRAFVERCAVGALANAAWLDADNATRKRIERWSYVPLRPTLHSHAMPTPVGSSGRFEMTDAQDEVVSWSLTWIISMPIIVQIEGGFEVVGVFNVDGLDYRITAEQLLAIYSRVYPYAAAMTGVLAGLPRDLVAIIRVRR